MDVEAKKIIENLRNTEFGLASVYIKVPDESILNSKYNNDDKKKIAQKIVRLIRRKKLFYEEKSKSMSGTSITTIPFFDIDYKTILKIITKTIESGEKLNLTSSKELHTIHQNIHFFERLFGFKFQGNYSLNVINNQSHVTLDRIYPEIVDSDNEGKQQLLQGRQMLPPPSMSLFQRTKLLRNKDFRILNEPSDLINNSQSFLVL
jgi:hypothetical protein